MILRLENVHANGIIPYLDGKRLYRIYAIDESISKYQDHLIQLDEDVFEIQGEFEIRDNVIYAK